MDSPPSDGLEALFAVEAAASEQTRSPLERYSFGLSFTGSASEYFRIWMVNVALTVLTLGIYAAWAKVRTRRYFYANTHLDGHRFDYTAKPANLLAGNLVIAAALFIFYGALNGVLSEVVLYSAIGLGVLLYPWLAYKSIRFRSQNTLYRNLRFRFSGKLGEAYGVYLGWATLAILLFFIYPIWAHRKKQYVYGRQFFGGKPFRFKGDPGKFFWIYFQAFLMGLGALFLIGVVISVIASLGTLDAVMIGEEYDTDFFIIIGFLSYALYWLCFVFLQQFVFGKVTQYTFENLDLVGDFRFCNTMSGWKLAWICFVNQALAILSFGLLIPWGRVRRARYILENIKLESTEPNLDGYVADSAKTAGAIGDSAVDMLDFEVGW